MYPFSQWILIFSPCIITIIKTTDEFRNVGDAAMSRDAYAMSHLSVEACTQRLAAEHGDGYRLAAATAVAIARVRHRQWSCLLNVHMTTNYAYGGSHAVHSEMLPTEKGRRKRTERTQHEKPPNGSRGKAPSYFNTLFSSLLSNYWYQYNISLDSFPHNFVKIKN